jgi:hypothetical protein
MGPTERPQVAARHRYRNAAGAGPARLGERETAARNDRIAQALRADVTIDLRDVDTAHLLVEHRALAAEFTRYRAGYERLDEELDNLVCDHVDLVQERDQLRTEVAILRSVVTAVLADGPDEFGDAKARPYPQLDAAQAAAVERAMGERT